MAYVTPPTYEAIRCEISGKPTLRKKTYWFLGTGQECNKDGLLPSIKRNICESLEMCSLWYIRILKAYLILLCLWWSIFICYVSATTVWFLSHLCCLYCRRYDRCLVCVDTIVLLSGIHPFSAVNPGFFTCMNWDSPWYLVVLVAVALLVRLWVLVLFVDEYVSSTLC